MSDVFCVAGRHSRVLNRWLQGRRRVHGNVLCVDMPLGGKKVGNRDLGDAVLAGLGKRDELNFGYKDAALLADAWLTHTDVRAVLVCESQLLEDRHILALTTWMTAHDIDIWFVHADEISAARTAELTSGEVVGFVELWRTFRNPTSLPPTPVESTPALPRCDALVFRSRCRELLDAAEFARFDVEYITEVEALLDKFETGKNRKERFSIATTIKQRLDSATSTDQLVLRARAAQIAGIRYGYLVGVDTAKLVGSAEALPRAGKAEPERWWERLDRYRDPDCGASAALYTFGFAPGAIGTITVGQVCAARRGNELVFVDSDGEEIRIGAAPARFVNTLATFRQLCGAEDSSPLFRYIRTDRPADRGRVNDSLTQPAAEIGVKVAKAPVRATPRRGLDWLIRYGVDIRRAIPESTTAKTLKATS